MRGGWEARAGFGAGIGADALGGRGANAASEPGTPDLARVAVVAPALERAAAVLCARWKPTLVLLLAAGARRRADIDRGLPEGVSAKVVTEQLRGLEADGIVERIDYRAIRHAGQRHVTYALTPAGQDLSGVVRSLAEWGIQHTRYGRGQGAPVVQGGDAAMTRNRVADADAPRVTDLLPLRPGA